ncbi:hypothetical protein [Marinoscillum sp.]|uniref:hypothetical protein n=1 Tax=Marinoscillum sp. TaxID=2024838 RepID=UPI003BAD4FB9
MKNKRSGIWMKKKSSLEARESRVKDELEEASENFESQVKKVVIISLISGGVVLAGYTLFKALTKEEKPPAQPPKKTAEKAQQIKVKEGFSVKKLLLEKATLAAIQFVGTQLALILSKKMGTESVSKKKTTR